MNRGKYLISLFGSTSVGKGTIGKYLEKEMINIYRLPLDYCLRDKLEEETILDYISRGNTDWKLVEEIVNHPIGAIISLPVFEYDNFTRVKKNGGKDFELKEVIILDGLYPYLNADLIVGLNLDPVERIKRLKARHYGERKQVDKTWFKFCIQNWDQMPNVINRFVGECDLVLNTSNPIDQMAKEIMDHIPNSYK